jgi:hypothetical protein
VQTGVFFQRAFMGEARAKAGFGVAALALRHSKGVRGFLALSLRAANDTLHGVQDRPWAVTAAGEGAIVHRGAFSLVLP